MPDQDHSHGDVHPRTAVLTRGFDPSLSFGSARPAVFRSSTYVFASPEAAEQAFAITTGKIKPPEGERADLIYSRFSHPNAEILEDQIVPLEAGGARGRGLQFRHGGHHDGVLRLRAAGQLDRLHHAALRRHHRPDPHFLEPFGVHGIPVRSGDSAGHRRGHPLGAESAASCYLETPANPDPDHDRYRARGGSRGPATRTGRW